MKTPSQIQDEAKSLEGTPSLGIGGVDRRTFLMENRLI